MPIRSSVLQLSPLAPLRPSSEPDEPSSMELERMKLMREEFENTKAQQARQMELAKLEEGGRMARERMQGEREIAKLQSAKEEVVKKQKMEAFQKFSELNGQGDIEGARALVPMMDSLGMSVDLEGEDELGLPRYRIEMDAGQQEYQDAVAKGQAAQRGDEMGAAGIGYPTDESGPVGAGPGIGSTQDAFTQALAASQQARDTGAPARGPDAPDTMGAVPKNVIDLSAQHQNTLKRLNPALGALVDAYPEEDRASAASTAAGISQLGLGGKESVKMYDQLRGGPDAAERGKVAAEAQAAQFAEKRTDLTPMESQRLVNMGHDQAIKAGNQLGLKTSLEARKAAQQIHDVLTDPDHNNDRMIGSLMSSMLAEKGAKTEGDIKRALGMDSMSTMDQVQAYVDKIVDGGMNFEQRAAILGVVKNSQEIDRKKLHGFLRDMDEKTPTMKPEVAQGWNLYRDIVIPKDVRDEYEDAKKAKPGSGQASSVGARDESGLEREGYGKPKTPRDADYEDELMVQAADAGLDPDAIKDIINRESGGNPSARNRSGATGLIQFMPDTAKSLGTTTEALKKMTASEQVPYVVKYFKDKGITSEHDQGDYYVAVAAPAFVGEPDETVVYKKGTPEYDQNPSWDTDHDGVVTVGDLREWGTRGSGNSQAASEDAKPKSGADRVREILARKKR